MASFLERIEPDMFAFMKRIEVFRKIGGYQVAEWNAVQERFANVEGAEGVRMRQEQYAPYFQRMGKDVRILPGCYFDSPWRIVLDDGARINRDAIFEGCGSIWIGRNARLGHRFFVHSANHEVGELDPRPIFERGHDFRPTILGDNVLVSANVSVLPGTHLGHGSFVAAGATVVRGDYPEGSFLVGAPARHRPRPVPELEPEWQPDRTFALLVPDEPRLQEAARLLLTVLACPQVGLLNASEPVPDDTRAVLWLGEEGAAPRLPEGVDLWQLADGTPATAPLSAPPAPGREPVELPRRLDYETAFNGFALPTDLRNTARASLFVASNRDLKGTQEQRNENRLAWSLTLLMALEFSSPDEPRWGPVFDRIGPDLIDERVTGSTWATVGRAVLTETLTAALEEIAVNSPMLKEFFGFPGAVGPEHVVDTLYGAPHFLPFFVWLHKDDPAVSLDEMRRAGLRRFLSKAKTGRILRPQDGVELCRALIEAVKPTWASSLQLASLGCAHLLLGDRAAAEAILNELFHERWADSESCLLLYNPDYEALDYYPPLVAFLSHFFVEATRTEGLVSEDVSVEIHWGLVSEGEGLSGLVDHGSRRVSRSLLEGWLTLQAIQPFVGCHFYLANWNYHAPCSALEQTWRDLVQHVFDQAHTPLLHVRPWPAGYVGCLSLRYDVDRDASTPGIVNIVRIQKEHLNAACGSWYYLKGEEHNKHVKDVLRGWNQEVAVHTRHLSDGIQGQGATAHSSTDSEYWKGQASLLALEESQATYAEAMLTNFACARPAWTGERRAIWVTPPHYPLEGSGDETSTDYFDTRREAWLTQIASGGHLIIGSHPDCNQDVLDLVLERKEGPALWPTTVARAVERVRALTEFGHVQVVVREHNGDDEFALLSAGPIADVATLVRSPGGEERTVSAQLIAQRPRTVWTQARPPEPAPEAGE